MTLNPVEITALSPLVFGDGRPFSNEAGAQVAGGLELPAPSTLAGALRAHIGRSAEDSSTPDWKALLEMEIHGPLLYQEGRSVLLRAPSDMVLAQRENGLLLVRSRPTELKAGGMDLPQGLLPAMIPEIQDLNPTKAIGPRWLSLDELARWYEGKCLWEKKLSAEGAYEFPPGYDFAANDPKITVEARTHVGIAFETGAAEDGLVYMTKGVHYGKNAALLARATAPLPEGPLFLGGERRLAAIKTGNGDHWKCPESVRAGLQGQAQVAMVLATPAHFTAGWKPDVSALAERLRTDLKLVSAACRRREAVSGWDLVRRGPKPARWLVPAGAVYWFKTSNAAPLADAWLQPVSDEKASRNDGFGLALFFPTSW